MKARLVTDAPMAVPGGVPAPRLSPTPSSGVGQGSPAPPGVGAGPDVRPSGAAFRASSVYLQRLRPGSLPAARSGLQTLARCFGSVPYRMAWADLTRPHVLWLRARLAERYAPGTCNKLLSYLRGVLRECLLAGHLTSEGYTRLTADLRVRGKSAPVGRCLTGAELERLHQQAHARDRAGLWLGARAGARVHETVALRWSDWDAEAAELRIAGKGAVTRVVPIGRRLTSILETWRAQCDTERIVALAVRSWYGAVVRLRDRAKVKRFTPHDLRRTYISGLLERGADLAVAQQLAGHADPRTTSNGYDRRPATMRRAAVERLEDE